MPDGFHQYAIDDHDLRILVLDSLEDGRHGGGFCETRAAWLKERLAEAPERPTLLVLHHPPIESGHSWMTENPEAGWVKRLESIVAAQTNIVAIVAGHLHRPVVTQWAGTTLAVCPSTAPQVALDFAPIDPDRPDDRPMIVADPPWFAIHVWNGATSGHPFRHGGRPRNPRPLRPGPPAFGAAAGGGEEPALTRHPGKSPGGHAAFGFAQRSRRHEGAMRVTSAKRSS